MTPDEVDRILGIKKFVPKRKTPVEEFSSIHKNMKVALLLEQLILTVVVWQRG